MNELPQLRTARLLLRPFLAADAPAVERCVSDRDVARMTLSIPHPYPEGAAVTWIASHAERFATGHAAVFGITTVAEGLVGAIGLEINPEHRHAELGYWIGKNHWNHGYATEAARAVLSYGFRERLLHKIFARHMRHNPASGRVLQKLGMQHEGGQRQHFFRLGEFVDLELYAVLRDEFDGQVRA